MLRRLTLWHKALLLIAVPLVFELLFVAVLLDLQKRTEIEVARETRARNLSVASNKLILHFYVACLRYSGKQVPESLSPYTHNPIAAVSEDMSTIASNCDDQREAQRIISLRQRVRDCARSFATVFIDPDADIMTRSLGYQRAVKEGRQCMDDIIVELHDLNDRQRNIQDESQKRQRGYRESVAALLWVAVPFNILLAIVVAFYFHTGISGRLKILMDNTHLLSVNRALHAPVGGVDEIAHLDATFHDMAAKKAETDQLKRDLINMVSHDLRSPLTSLLAVVSMLKDETYGALSPDGKEILSQSRNNVLRLISLINDLLDVERLESGVVEFNPKDVAVSDIVIDCMNSLNALTKAKQLRFDVYVGDARVFVDKARATQVLVNIVGNAIEVSPERGIITIESLRVTADHVEVRVADQGPGIPDAMKETVFEKFRQVERRSTSPTSHSGLGLAICKSIIERSGGSIGVENGTNSGCTFWFRLPASHAIVLPRAGNQLRMNANRSPGERQVSIAS